MIDDVNGLIKRWYEKSKKEENVFDQFITLWVSFHFFYSKDCLDETEFSNLHQFVVTYQDQFQESIHKEPKFNDFLVFIKTKPFHTGYVQDCRVIGTVVSNRYSNIKNLNAYIRCLNLIQSNIHQDSKSYELEQDKELVRLAYQSFLVLLEYIYRAEGIL
jgi:hypothetical protein